ncbi:hypothetical protein Natpe_1283 [Natrinema pellirubrum DSM 15624]|uniref:Right handed beta helix domain-containing protein n=2 Tax=Natrinema pellirubrum (strain DSM 15624 / CIP 106293 / JCM 10476 / NCIMB 786 / 157) TaxID=797303 RepID=L0JK18_NATP1|nr:hypothetical protein [Natrinema pellirubrum]AGB31188.1 hypothetical protein Natpe_1283 [Natrinema pellirubrum DSM 15624]
MARDPSVSDGESSPSPDGEASDDGGKDGLLHRRSYMKLAGATTAAATLTGAAAAAGDEYETIEARGQTIRIGRGETFENKLIDLTTGEGFLLYVEGANATIRNVGFEGLYRGDSFMISIKAGVGDILVENVYLGDGATKEGSSFVHGPGGVFMHPENDADVTFRHCNVQGFPNNGFYCSNTPYGGSVRFERCFGKNNGVTTFRCGSADDEIVDCVAYNDDTDYGPGYGGYGETSGRPVWVWNGGTVTIRDSHFAAGPYPYALVAGANGSPGSVDFQSGGVRGEIQRASGSTVDVASAVSSDPDLSVPDGVPTTPEEAATGDSDGSSGPTAGSASETDSDGLPNLLLVDGSPADATRYEFTVDGDVERSTAEGASIDDEDRIDGSTVQGSVADWKDAFRFAGDLTELTVDGPGSVLVNSEAVDPDDYGSDLPHVLEVSGDGTATSYEITVDGTIELVADDEPAAEATTVSGSTVQSSITDGTQTFRFSGAVTDVTFSDGAATITVDGEPIDPSEYGDHEMLPHALVIDGTDADGPTTYAFEVDGAVVRSDYRDASIDDEDVVENGTVRGAVGNWLDAYWFDGDIDDFRLRGDAAVDLQYNARDQ